MKTYKKGTIEYKINAASVNYLGVTVIVNYWISVIFGGDVLREAIVWSCLEVLFLLFCAWAEYDIIRTRPIYLQALVCIDSLACIWYCFSVIVAISVCLLEACVLMIIRHRIRKKK